MVQSGFDQFDRMASARIERMSEAWGSLLLGSRDEAVIAELHKELEVLTDESHELLLTEVTLLCEKLDELTQLAHRRSYDVPEELFLTVSMGIELLGFLISNPEGGADLAGFVTQLDAVLQDARLLPDPTASDPPTSASRRTPAPASNKAVEPPDHLSRATRLRFARVATTVYLEAVRAAGPSALRLRESWGALRRELTELGRVSLRAHLLPLLEQVETQVDARQKNVQITVDLDDIAISSEVAHSLETAILRLVDRAIVDGIESPSERARLGKPVKALVKVHGRVADGRVSISVHDDGAGVDVAAVARAATAKGLLPEGSPVDEKRVHALMLERRFKAAGLGGEIDLAAVREAIARDDGTLQLRSVAGRGCALTISIPNQATMNVRTFRSPMANALLAVDTSWSVEGASGGNLHRLDVVGALGLRSRLESTAVRSVAFGKGNLAFEVEVRAAPTLNVATRLFPPDAESATEVVLVGGAEAILLRPELLAKASSQSTVPPPVPLLTRSNELAPHSESGPRMVVMDTDASWRPPAPVPE